MSFCDICCKTKKVSNSKCYFCGFNCCSNCLFTYFDLNKDTKCMNTDCSKNFDITHLKCMLSPCHFNKIKKKIIDWEFNKQMNMLKTTAPLVEFYNKYDLSIKYVKNNKILLEKLREEQLDIESNMKTVRALLSLSPHNTILTEKKTRDLLTIGFNNQREIWVKEKTNSSDIRKAKYQIKKNESYIEKFDKSHGLDMIKTNITAFPCPKENCKGFIMKTSIKCNTCESKACLKCEMLFNTTKHTCLQSTLDTITEINKTTKRCPNCSTRIFRILGCNHMWCSRCYTGFDFRTGELISDERNTNPHLANFRSNNRFYTIRNTQDLICGGLMNLREIGDDHSYMNGSPDHIKKGLLSIAEKYIITNYLHIFTTKFCFMFENKEKFDEIKKKWLTNFPLLPVHRISCLITHLQNDVIPVLRKRAMKNDLFQDQRVDFIRQKINKNQFIKLIKNIKIENDLLIFQWQMLEMLIEISIPETNHLLDIFKTLNSMKTTTEEEQQIKLQFLLNTVINEYLNYYEKMLRLFDFYNMQIINNFPDLNIFDLSQIFLGRTNTDDFYYKTVWANNKQFPKQYRYDGYNLGSETLFIPHSTFIRDHYNLSLNKEFEQLPSIGSNFLPYPFILPSSEKRVKSFYYWDRCVYNDHMLPCTFPRGFENNFGIPFLYKIKKDFTSAYTLNKIIQERINITQYEEKTFYELFNDNIIKNIPMNLKICRKNATEIDKIVKISKIIENHQSLQNEKFIFEESKINEIRSDIGFPLPGGIIDKPTIQNQITQLCSQS